MGYQRKIIGERIYLAPLCVEDAEKYAEWINDLSIAVLLTGVAQQNFSPEQEREFLKEATKGHEFGIVLKDSDRLIGKCNFEQLDLYYRHGEVGIFIGDKNYWGKGYGTEALTLLLEYGFGILNLHNIMLKVKAFNERAIRSYEKCGFRRVGVRRQSVMLGGVYHDEIYMDILADEFSGHLVQELVSAPNDREREQAND